MGKAEKKGPSGNRYGLEEVERGLVAYAYALG